MNMNQLAKEICKKEGKKKQINIAQVKEILGCLSDILLDRFIEDGMQIYLELVKTGVRRSKKHV